MLIEILQVRPSLMQYKIMVFLEIATSLSARAIIITYPESNLAIILVKYNIY